MWGSHLTQTAEALPQAAVMPMSDPVQLAVGLLLTIALFVAH